jgi:iron complex outermembrane receptor protein
MKNLLTAVFILSAINVYAQDVVDLDPVSITPSRFAQKISETGRSVTVIDGKIISQLPVNSLDELLKYTSSVEIQQRGPAGAQADIVIRGGTFQQVLVLMDGVKLNDPITGHFSAYMPIVPSQIERIEILKGPAAAVYGSEAVGGVINIISKTFAALKKEKSIKGNAAVAAGEYGYFAANAGFHQNNQKINYSIAAQTNNASGQLLRGNNRGYFHNNTISANAGFAITKNWNLHLHSSFDNRDFAAQNFYTTFVSDTATEKVNTWWNHAKLKRNGKNATDEIDLAYKNTSDHYVFNPLSIANDNKSGLVTLQYVHSKILSQHLLYNYGLMAEQKVIRSNDRGDHSNKNAAAFGSVFYKVKNLSLNPGLRVVHDKNYGTELLPQANITYRLKKLALRANAGRAIRSGDFTERYNNYNKQIVNSGSIGNPDLTAENSWSYEAGADLFLKTFKFSVSGFYRKQDDVIDWVPTPYAAMPRKTNLNPAGSYALAKNIKNVNTSGVEFEVQYSRQFSEHHNLYANASATLLHSTSSDSVPSFYILSHAKALYQQTILYTFKNFQLGITSILKERKPLQAPGIKAILDNKYWLVNARVAYNYQKITAFLAINNIGNIAYSDLLGSKMPGSWSTVGLSYSF